ncbi:hypothetical protein HZS_5853 [Henneguya salminicola]|nr:hypothetical protein HZS_5853 [Henneguya salminicola]
MNYQTKLPRHFCKGYTSYNCKNRCDSIGGVEYCAYGSGEKLCINGATDKNTCEKYINKFRKKKIKCPNDICNNNGLCFIYNNKLKCKCQPWYRGKYCENFYCQNNCNQNGYCVSPNKCSCYHPYRGEYCYEYPCSFKQVNDCKNDGLCYHFNNTHKCYCSNSIYHGKNCDVVTCAGTCAQGKCVYIPNKKISFCMCLELAAGKKCTVINRNIQNHKNAKSIKIFLFLLSSLLFVLAMPILLKYSFEKMLKKKTINSTISLI